MPRMTYKTVLRAKRIKPIPSPDKLRSSLHTEGRHLGEPWTKQAKPTLEEVIHPPVAHEDLGVIFADFGEVA